MVAMNSKVKAALLLTTGGLGVGALTAPLAYGVGKSVGGFDVAVKYNRALADQNVQIVEAALERLDSSEEGEKFGRSPREIADAYTRELGVYKEIRDQIKAQYSFSDRFIMGGILSSHIEASMDFHWSLVETRLLGRPGACAIPQDSKPATLPE